MKLMHNGLDRVATSEWHASLDIAAAAAAAAAEAGAQARVCCQQRHLSNTNN